MSNNPESEESDQSSCLPCKPLDTQLDHRWMSMHSRFVNEAKESEPEVVFIGDYVTENLLYSHIWERDFCGLHSINFSISTDRTEHILWRLQNGELDFLSPKVIVLSAGNNTADLSLTPSQIADGIKALCSLIRDKQPQAYIVILTLLPRGQNPNVLRDQNENVNEILTEYVKGNSLLQLVPIDKGFVQTDGTITNHDMYDYLHLTQKGYQKAFEPGLFL